MSFRFHSHLQFLTGLYSILLGLTFKSFTGLSPARPNPNLTNAPIRTSKTKPNKHIDRNLENQTQQMHHHLILIPIAAWVQTSSQSRLPPGFATWSLGLLLRVIVLISLGLLLHDSIFVLRKSSVKESSSHGTQVCETQVTTVKLSLTNSRC